jgi:hypothetical protein
MDFNVRDDYQENVQAFVAAVDDYSPADDADVSPLFECSNDKRKSVR